MLTPRIRAIQTEIKIYYDVVWAEIFREIAVVRRKINTRDALGSRFSVVAATRMIMYPLVSFYTPSTILNIAGN